MLLATYALLTLRIEQAQERASIRQLQECLALPCNGEALDGARLAALAEALIKFAESLHQRRLEDALFPALRVAAAEPCEALRNLEHLCAAGLDMLPRIRAALRPRAYSGQHELAGVHRLVQAYCQNLLDRLACEEDDLLPLAERSLHSETWFNVGTQFLQQDAQRA